MMASAIDKGICFCATATCCVLLSLTIISTQGFTSARVAFSSRLRPSVCTMGESSTNELFDSPGWEFVRKDLDQVPVFACANAQGQPLKYRMELTNKLRKESSDEAFEVPLFYTHVDDALAELIEARKNTPLLGIDINPYPLGQIFQLWAADKAVIVPNKNAIVQAGAPPNANPMGQNVPLFACMEIAQENEEGKPVLPIFLDLVDIKAAISQAVSFDGGNVDDFEVVCLSLPEAVRMLVNGTKESMAFHFIPPISSLKHIRKYLSG